MNQSPVKNPENSPALSQLLKNRDSVYMRIQAACELSNRSIDDIRLIWVSKTHPPELIRLAPLAGAKYLGENRVQEILEKFPLEYPANSSPCELHLIGHLQRNKVRKVLPLIQAIHSVDSIELLMAIARVASELQLKPKIFLQVNTSGESTKTGFSLEELEDALSALAQLSNVKPWGLMTIGPTDANHIETRLCFKKLRILLEKAQNEFKDQDSMSSFQYLSMGMSGDFEIAIEEGAHFLRIGSALFGHRDYGSAN